MAIVTTSVTVLGTARPWKFAGSGVDFFTTPNTVVAFASGYNDGTTAGGSSSLNSSYRYGRHHNLAGETNPSTVAVTPGHVVAIKYLSGTVQTQAAGEGNSTPIGGNGTHFSLGPNETDDNGYSYPSNFISGCTTTMGGLVGCFTDSSGAVIAGSFWDWKSRGGTASANSFISLIVPAGAAFLSLGILDSALDDNTGSFSTTVFEMDDYGFSGDNTFFMHTPIGFTSAAFLGDQTIYQSLVWLAVGLLTLVDISTTGLMSGYFGQIFPHGAQNTGGTPSGAQGQNFPY